MAAQCPGEERFLKDPRDLNSAAFRRLVGVRARKAGELVGVIVDDDQRRDMESALEKSTWRLTSYPPVFWPTDTRGHGPFAAFELLPVLARDS